MSENDGKFWGPVVDGDRVVAWARWDSMVPGAVEAIDLRRSGVAVESDHVFQRHRFAFA